MGRPKADDTAVMEMFSMVYTGENAVAAPASDESMTADEKWKLLHQLEWVSLKENTKRNFLVTLRKWKRFIYSTAGANYAVYPISKASAFLASLLDTAQAADSKDPEGMLKGARKALRHLKACQRGVPQVEFAKDPLISGVVRQGRDATAAMRSSDKIDPSASATTLNSAEVGVLLEACMNYPDVGVGMAVGTMITVGILAGLRGDDLADARYVLELVEPVQCTPHVFNILALAALGGKGNSVYQLQCIHCNGCLSSPNE